MNDTTFPQAFRLVRLLTASLLLMFALTTACSRPAVPVGISDQYRNYYEIFVRSFYDQDGDGIGDLAGVTARLDYITRDLGADGIWLMPIMPSPTYHKYDVTDYRTIDPEYGTLADFDALIAAAHERDVKVIIDLVVNHTSNLHPWFEQAVSALWKGTDSPYIDYYNFTLENPGEGYNKITDKYYYECRFVSGMPDLNLDSPAVRAELLEIAFFWLDRGVDGFRLDAVTSFYTGNRDKNIAFLGWLNDSIKEKKPDAYLIGEAWSEGGIISDYYASGIDSFFNFPYAQATGRLVAALNSKTGQNFAAAIATWNQQIRVKNAGAIDALFLSNHDHARSAGFLMRDLQKQKMAAALYLLAPGNPFIYYGEEIGMTGSGKDENHRLPMLWSETEKTGMTLPPPGATQTIEGIRGADKQARDRNSLLYYYRQILEIKRKHPEIARGVMTPVNTGNSGVAAWFITWDNQRVYVLHNLLSESVRIDLGQSDLDPAALDSLTVSDYLVTERGKPRLSGTALSLPAMSTTIIRGRFQDGQN